MTDKLDKAVEAITLKTKNNKIEWERMTGSLSTQNVFYKQYILDGGFEYDGINCYVAHFKDGYIYFNNSSSDEYKELAIQPSSKSDITVLAFGSKKLKELENSIKNTLDNPDDFIDSLLNE